MLAARMDRRTFVLGTLGLVVGGDAVASARLRAGDPRLRELARVVDGAVIGRGTSAYPSARVLFNERFDGVKPLAVLRAGGAADVRQAILWARKHGIRVRARSGGHSYAGYSTVEDGLVIDLSSIEGIAVDKPTRTATVGAGARLIDVYARLANAGGTIPAGSCPTVGVGGLALGGGVGFASRKLGTTADNVIGLTIVTADGRRLACDRRRHADLFWACRGGGGGNFGVVTSFRFRVHPVTRASYFVLTWPWTSMDEAVAAWQRFAPRAPDGLFSVCRLATGTSTPTVQAFGQFFGSEAALVTLLTPLRDVPGASLSTGTSTYLDLMKRWAGCKTFTLDECDLGPSGSLDRQRFAAKSDYVAKPLSPVGIKTMRSWLEKRQGRGGGAAILDSYGGAINRVAPAATAFVHRRQLFSIQYFASIANAAGDASAISWLRGFRAAMHPFASGFAYQNYIDADLVAWEHAYYGSNYPRLRRVKSKYDPDNVFRFRQSIRPER
jgi:FAD/FMN-containing dehydrogenase